MTVELPAEFEGYIKLPIGSGRYASADEAVHAAFRKLEESEEEIFPEGSLAHLYIEDSNREEAKLARQLRVPSQGPVDS